MNDLPESRELIRRLKKGSPVEVEGDVIRLPRFTEIREAEPTEFGLKGSQELIVAKSRTATWCLWPLDRRQRFAKKDSEKFLRIIDAVGEHIPEKPVKGWVLTTAPVSDDSREELTSAGHHIHRVS